MIAVCLLAGSAPVNAQYEPIPGPATDLYGATREYRWTVYVPVLTYERREIAVAGPTMVVRSRRFDYEAPGLKTERRKLWQYPELTCKYPDWFLPNECGVAWRDVYADFPQITMRRDHIDADVIEWADGEYRMRVDVPKWTWTPREYRLLMPVLETEPAPPHEWSRAEGSMLADVERMRGTIGANERTVSQAIEQALASLDRSIAAIEAGGGDPSRLASTDGSSLDLRALRRMLAEEETAQLDRYAQVRSELNAAIAGGPAASVR